MLLLHPPLTTSNYVFRNNGDLTFTDKTKEWRWDDPSFSNGMAYGDLDVVAGNHGLNGNIRATEKEPLRAYSRDYVGNERPDLLLSQFRCVTPHGPSKE